MGKHRSSIQSGKSTSGDPQHGETRPRSDSRRLKGVSESEPQKLHLKLPARVARVPSLTFTLAAVVTALALVPTLLMALFYLPSVGKTVDGSVVAWLLLVALLWSLTSFIIARLLLKPINDLRDEVVQLAQSKQRLNEIQLERIENQPPEVSTLRAAFSSLLDALRLEQGKRGAFMATLVHDLKTPIIAGNHVLEVIKSNDNLSKVERVQLVSSLRAENEALLALVQKMVDAHRFEREDVQLSLEPTDLKMLADGLVARFAARASEHQVELDATGEGRALTSKPELERAVSNLLDNAIRYAKHKVSLLVDGASLTVIDDGVGLPTSLEELALPFNTQHVELAGQQYTSGTGGLGLFIAQRIAASHGGNLESLPSWSGTKLRISLQAVV
jgi:signal transduction histidine kinase